MILVFRLQNRQSQARFRQRFRDELMKDRIEIERLKTVSERLDVEILRIKKLLCFYEPEIDENKQDSS